jgi:hypothetical protein
MMSDALVRSIIGPFGSGKSVACCIEIGRRAAMQKANAEGKRRTKWVVVRNTNQQLKDTALKTWLEWFPEGKVGTWRAMDQTFQLRMPGPPDEITGKPTQIEADVLFRALDSPDDVKRLLSLELTGAWVNEFREIPIEIPMNLIGRIGRFPPKVDEGCTWTGILMDSNPPDLSSAYYKMFEEAPDPQEAADLAQEYGVEVPEFPVWKQPSGLSDEAENLEWLPGGKQYYVNMVGTARRLGKDSSWVDVHVHGKYGFIMDGRAVYADTFSFDRHVSDKPLRALEGKIIGVGMDFGLTPAAVWGQVDHEGRWIILGEMVTEDMAADEFGILLRRVLRQKYPGQEFIIYADPAGEQRSQVDARSVFDVLRAQGWKLFASEQSPRMRIDSVRGALSRDIRGAPGMLIDRDAGTIIRGFQGGYQYRRMKVSGDRYTEKPDKNEFSHPHDALQYLIAYFDAPRLRGGSSRDFPTGLNSNFMGDDTIVTSDYDFWR